MGIDPGTEERSGEDGLPSASPGYEGGHDRPADPPSNPGIASLGPRGLALQEASVIVELVVRLAPQPASVAAARRMVTEALVGVDVEPAALEDIRLAVSEACSNAVLHGPATGTYEVSLRLHGESCEIQVRDAGPGPDLVSLPDSLPPVASPSGRGLAIMRAVMDEVEVRADPDHGTVVRLVKRLTPGP